MPEACVAEVVNFSKTMDNKPPAPIFQVELLCPAAIFRSFQASVFEQTLHLLNYLNPLRKF